MVYRIAFHYFGNREDAEDVTQDVFLKIFSSNESRENDEELKEMAKMEMGAKEIKNYAQSTEPKKERKPREKKIDVDKAAIIRTLFECMKDGDYENLTIKNEQKEITFSLHDCEYSLNLVKHRPPKK